MRARIRAASRRRIRPSRSSSRTGRRTFTEPASPIATGTTSGPFPRAIESLVPDLALTPGDRVLDYGCADLPYRDLFPADLEYLAADLPGNPLSTTLIAPDGTVPVESESCDTVVSTQVLEHVRDPALYLAECHRVLKPGGRLLLSTHGTFVYHPDPEDYWRWTAAGLEEALRVAGLRVVRVEGVIGQIAIGLQLIQDAIYWHLPRPFRAVLAAVMQTMIAAADRLQSPGSKRLNASVYALIAERP